MDIIKLCELCERYYKVAIKKSQLDKGEFNSIRSVGGRIKYLKERGFKSIGQGSSRGVFLINNQKVLKLATNYKGIAQNQVEFANLRKSDRYGIFPKAYDKAPDDSWIEVEHVRILKSMDEVAEKFGLTYGEFKQYIYLLLDEGEDKIRLQLREYKDEIRMQKLMPGDYIYARAEEYEKILSNRKILTLVRTLKEINMPFNELRHNAEQWGIGGDGRIVIADSGFTMEVYNKLYRGSSFGEDIREDYEYSKEPEITDPVASGIRNYRSKDPKNIL